ncbi:MAG: hypothetical protein AB1807_05185 [Pseudomonadota bacterium]
MTTTTLAHDTAADAAREQRWDRLWRRALWAVPLCFGLLSLLMRQDSNWDLRNYHLYNPFALLNGKIGLDLAPAQMQTYFNPAIDLLYYGLVKSLPGPLAGFVMGVLHGLNFVLVALLARALLPPGPARSKLCLGLALAGMFGPAFVSELGNTMGDNLTALFVLSSLLLVVHHRGRLADGGGAGLAAAAGLLAGIATGLKLTNAMYALALCLALLVLPGAPLRRLRTSFVFGLGVLAGIALSGGFWYWKMWTLFGNPLFPQFNAIFHSPLALPIGVGDMRFLPQGLGDKLLWPFIFAIDPLRVSEIRLTALIWPVLYVGFVLLAAHALLRRRAATAAASATPVRLLWVFVALSYLIWLNLFSIYRYLVPLELLAPLVLWLIAQHLLPGRLAARIVGVLLVLAFAASLHTQSWGRAGWAREAYGAQVPAIANPAQSMVFTLHSDPPMGWLVTLFPADLAFAALGSNFPESAGYRERVAQMVAARSGPLYVLLKGDRALSDPAPTPARRAAAEAAVRAGWERARPLLQAHGLALDSAGCTNHPARIGRNRMDFQLCPVSAAARGR